MTTDGYSLSSRYSPHRHGHRHTMRKSLPKNISTISNFTSHGTQTQKPLSLTHLPKAHQTPHLLPRPCFPPRAIQTVHVAVISCVSQRTKTVFRALKHAKTFETRKLIKRLKSARSSPQAAATVSKLEVELTAVKALSAEEINALAQEHVLRSIAKRKHVVAISLWPPELVIPAVEEGGERARMNVVSRLYGAAVVRCGCGVSGMCAGGYGFGR